MGGFFRFCYICCKIALIAAVSVKEETVHAATVYRLTKTYGSRFGGLSTRALFDVSFEVEGGEFVAVMGPSGSGKTTLLNMLALIDRPDSGTVSIGGRDIAGLSGDALSSFRLKTIGFVFQDSSLLDTLTLGENIALPLALNRLHVQEIVSRSNEIAEALGISDILGKYPAEVSGGEKQRAAAARALVTEPAILLADEPTGALDSRSSRDLLERFYALNRKRKTTIFMVSHDPYAASWADRVLFLSDGCLVTEIRSGGDRRVFFDRVMEVQSAMEGRF